MYTKSGKLTVICGPMFSGKSRELVRFLDQFKVADFSILAFRPVVDDRVKDEVIYYHNSSNETVKTNYRAQLVENSQELAEVVKRKNPQVVAIDEAQFFDNDLPLLADRLADEKAVFVTGLDTNFKREPFGPMADILALADDVVKLSAICDKCKNKYGEAIFTQRLIDGDPVSKDAPEVLTGREEEYQARCRWCHEVKEG